MSFNRTAPASSKELGDKNAFFLVSDSSEINLCTKKSPAPRHPTPCFPELILAIGTFNKSFKKGIEIVDISLFLHSS